MTRTRRSIAVHAISVLALLGIAALIGVAVGFAEHRVFILGTGPLLAGVGAGIAGGFQLYFAAPASRFVLLGIVLWTSIAACGGLHAGRLQLDRSTFDRVYLDATHEGFIREGDAEALDRSADPEALDRAWTAHLEDEVGDTGCWGHLRMRASLGVRILGNRGFETPAWVTWMVWALEWGLILVTVLSATAGVRARLIGSGVRASES